MPLAILHPIFGQFVQESQIYEPTATDNALVRDLRTLMSKPYDLEMEYSYVFRRILSQYYPDVQFEATLITSDGDSDVDKFIIAVCEGKLWRGTGDPEVQAANCLIASARGSLERVGGYPDKFPCMILYIFGEYSY